MNTYLMNHSKYTGGQAHNKKRMTRGQAILILLIFCFMCFMLGGLVFSAEAKSMETKPIESEAAEPAYKLVTVKSGDSLWNLAVRYHSEDDEDVRSCVNKLIELNQLEDLTIYPGQNLKVPLN